MRLPPAFRPLADRAVLIVWSGLCTSTIGEDLFRVASVWLAVEAAGNMAGPLPGGPYPRPTGCGPLGAGAVVAHRAARAAVRVAARAVGLPPRDAAGRDVTAPS